MPKRPGVTLLTPSPPPGRKPIDHEIRSPSFPSQLPLPSKCMSQYKHSPTVPTLSAQAKLSARQASRTTSTQTHNKTQDPLFLLRAVSHPRFRSISLSHQLTPLRQSLLRTSLLQAASSTFIIILRTHCR
ncbi:hypothetical protein Mapa_016344 [Marchantia paleacea]|nr:hypothetical protein Mapa_016344 [Marchantia paleacea]